MTESSAYSAGLIFMTYEVCLFNTSVNVKDTSMIQGMATIIKNDEKNRCKKQAEAL